MSAVLNLVGITKKTTRKTKNKSKTKRKPTKRTTVKKKTSKSKRTIVSKPKSEKRDIIKVQDYKRKGETVYLHRRRAPRTKCKLTNDRLYDTPDNMTYLYNANKKATKKYSKLSTSKKLQKGKASCGTTSKTSKIRPSKSLVATINSASFKFKSDVEDAKVRRGNKEQYEKKDRSLVRLRRKVTKELNEAKKNKNKKATRQSARDLAYVNKERKDLKTNYASYSKSYQQSVGFIYDNDRIQRRRSYASFRKDNIRQRALVRKVRRKKGVREPVKKPVKKKRLTKEQKRNMRRERLEKTKEGRATLRAEIEASLARRAKREDETQRKINENNARITRANRKKKQKK